MARLLVALALALSMSSIGPLQAEPFSPVNWTQDFFDDHVIARSPADERGHVEILTPLAAAFEGDPVSFVNEVADRFAQSIGSVIAFQPIVEGAELQQTGQPPAFVDALLDSYGGGKVNLRLYATLLPQPASSSPGAGTVQIVVIVAPEAIRNEPGADSRWNAAVKQAEEQSQLGIVLTEQTLNDFRDSAGAGLDADDGPVSQQAPPVEDTASQPPPPSQAPPITEVIWNARGNSAGVAFLSPCSTDGTTVLAAVRRREYWAMTNFPVALIDETRATIQTWTGGRTPDTIGQVERQGDLYMTTAAFTIAGQRLVGLFSLLKRSDNFVQRGYVLAPAENEGDQRFSAGRDIVQTMMLSGNYGELPPEGTAPEPANTSDVEGVFVLSGLAFALEDSPLNLAPVEIGLFKNGGATETSANLTGIWRRIPGGYSVEYGTGDTYIARASETCRSSAAVPSRPVPPPASAVVSAERACTSDGIAINFPRATSRQECSMLGGQQYCRMVPAFIDSVTTVHPRCQ